jgi:hypothetical protein
MKGPKKGQTFSKEGGPSLVELAGGGGGVGGVPTKRENGKSVGFFQYSCDETVLRFKQICISLFMYQRKYII